jgi:hypothetical protein
MPTYTITIYDFLSGFSDSIVFKPAYLVTSDSISFNESLTVPIIPASWIDGMSFRDEPLHVTGVHHVTMDDTLTFVDEAMRGSPQSLADYMVLVDEFFYAQNLLLDNVVFSDTILGVDSPTLYDTMTFIDSLATPVGVWVADAPDVFALADFMVSTQAFPRGRPVPDPWLPNWPLTSRRSGNPCGEGV